MVDALRLIRCHDDIGVIALEVIQLDSLTPAVRKTWADRYQPELARIEPQRLEFGPPSLVPLSDGEIDQLRRFVSALCGEQGKFKGLMYALKRFRSSVERYSPSDPERLLEYAIALEALYLNDQGTDRTELTYRLRLRAARFLGNDVNTRQALFAVIGDLYGFRSRVAHGEPLVGLRETEKSKLENVLSEGPVILCATIRRILESPVHEIPSGNTLPFWRGIELG
jgi:hypothetical protein